MKYLPLMFTLCLAISGCATDEQTRAAVTGGAIGAAAGAAMASDGDQAVAGALIGGTVGAATAAILADPYGRGGHDYRNGYGFERDRHDRRHRHGHRYGDGGDDD